MTIHNSLSLQHLPLPEKPTQWIAGLAKPDWDQYFLAMVFLAAMRSPDQETKQGCVIVDWGTKIVLGTGYNGHPRGAVEEFVLDQDGQPRAPVAGLAHWGHKHIPLPTTRPDKYACMVHADTNAAVNCRGASDNAVCYLSMPPCETCLGVLANLPTVRIRRIVYLEHRDLTNTFQLAKHLPHIRFEQYTGPHPAQLLATAATYAQLRTTSSTELSTGSATTYAGGAQR